MCQSSMTNSQGRRRLLKSGPAMKRRRRFTSAEGTSGGRAREGGIPPLVMGVRGIAPETILYFWTSLETI